MAAWTSKLSRAGDGRLLRPFLAKSVVLASLGLLLACGDSPLSGDPDACAPVVDEPSLAREGDAVPDCSARNQVPPLGADALVPCWSVVGEQTSFSSPRLADLTGDGALDVVLGLGHEAGGVGYATAVDGRTGEQLWRTEARAQLVASASFADLTGNGLPDVIIGGRQAELMAIDGLSGDILWQFYQGAAPGAASADGWFNFYTAQVTPDLDDDCVQDVLVANGGDPSSRPFEPRPPGHVMLLSGKSGELISFLQIPDGRETYMSPLLYQDERARTATIFGSGGSTWGGSLWQAPLSAILEADPTAVLELANTPNKGFIAPASLGDFDGDGRLDAVAASSEGVVVAVDLDGQVLFEALVDDAESHNAPLLAYVDDDEAPEVFVSMSLGAFPGFNGARHLLLDGSTGDVLLDQTFGVFASSGNIAVNLDEDPADEIILAVNLEDESGALRLQLFVLDEETMMFQEWGSAFESGSVASPWIGDVEGDGKLDLVVVTSDPASSLQDSDWTLQRFALDVDTPDRITWGAYLGTRHNGQVPPR